MNSKTWWIGSTESNLSREERITGTRARTLASRLAWVSCTALGSTVVPLVKRMLARSFGSAVASAPSAPGNSATVGAGTKGAARSTIGHPRIGQYRRLGSPSPGAAQISFAPVKLAARPISAAGHWGSSGTVTAPRR